MPSPHDAEPGGDDGQRSEDAEAGQVEEQVPRVITGQRAFQPVAEAGAARIL